MTSRQSSIVTKISRVLGPGLLTGAADDDPSGIATYSQTGAQLGYMLCWTIFLTTPFMVAIQIVSARVGAVTGRGLAANLRQALPPILLYGVMALFALANIFNIAADIAAMGEAVRLLIGGPAKIYALTLGVLCLAAQIFVSCRGGPEAPRWPILLSFVFARHHRHGSVGDSGAGGVRRICGGGNVRMEE
jgi:Mn2+/Fe2+ NRAMP family transporter